MLFTIQIAGGVRYVNLSHATCITIARSEKPNATCRVTFWFGAASVQEDLPSSRVDELQKILDKMLVPLAWAPQVALGRVTR